MHAYIRPNSFIVLRLPSGLLKVLEIVPNTTVSIGKFGTFPANQLIGRPYNLTFEILDKEDGLAETRLRVIPASELHEEVLKTDASSPADGTPAVGDANGEAGVEFDIVGENGEVLMRSNRLTIDDPTRQALSMEEIEELKKAGTSSGKDIIAKIMASHQALDEKTAFSLAKYTLRKSRKYLKRFTVLPMDVSMLAEVLNDREAHRVMEAREEMLGLIGSWANVRYGGENRLEPSDTQEGAVVGGGRWLVVDETGGLIVAALAEKMGILYPPEEEDDESDEEDNGQPADEEMPDAPEAPAADGAAQSSEQTNGDTTATTAARNKHAIPAMSAETNSLTLLHSNAQPNLGLLKYFGFDASSPNQPPTHPLYTHLKSLSWLQLLSPNEDAGYAEPERLDEETLKGMKSGKRGTYYRKRRRWERVRRVVEETRGGGFDGLVIASAMEPATIMKHAVPLLRGGAQVVVYSPTVEPLTELMDLYGRDRKTAFINASQERGSDALDEAAQREFDDDFPVNPTLLLAPMLQTARVRSWQVLPGRTHPMMTSKGGAEGFLFTATRVLPAEGKIEARGKFSKKRKPQEKPKEEKKPAVSAAEDEQTGGEAKKIKVEDGAASS